jgi:uncharacterized protein
LSVIVETNRFTVLGRRYAGSVTSFDLRSRALRAGEELAEQVDASLEPFLLGGQEYAVVPAVVPAMLRITKATSGTVLELSFTVRLEGPCFRCLAETALDVPIAAREYQSSAPDALDEERSEYVADDRVDLSTWARDAVALALPDKILCRPECAGLCPVCGKDLNLEPHEHTEHESDSRWAALETLKDRL